MINSMTNSNSLLSRRPALFLVFVPNGSFLVSCAGLHCFGLDVSFASCGAAALCLRLGAIFAWDSRSDAPFLC